MSERAKSLGLQEPAEQILYGAPEFDMNQLVIPEMDGVDTVDKVEDGIKHIIAYMISKNSDVLEEIRKL